ncbi:MAG TPA: enoyl-CoA hydratase-related protein [Pseudomonadales bacterium]|nr:enoyl-CoA hydratase-related protein [Pseudomonadales bacterium]
MNYEHYHYILAERRNRILTLTLNRPQALNAVSKPLHDELAQIFTDVQNDDETDVVVLTGAGRAFCAGGDLAEMKANIDAGRGDYMNPVDAKRIVFSLLDLEKPIIARINGPCMGLGATIALLCDMTVAVNTAKIGDPHVRAGVVAGDGGAVIWPQLIGYARAKEYLMLCDALTADEAARIGLINYSVPAEELDSKVYGLAERLANGPQMATRWTKTVMNIGLKQLAHSMMDASVAYEWQTFRMPEHAEAVTAFVEGRAPDFKKVR